MASGDRAGLGEIVSAGYGAVADRYAELERDHAAWPRSRRIDDLIARLEQGARVLDLGCGNGVPVARTLADAGMRVTGVDLSAEHVARAASAVPKATFAVADMLGVTFPDESFDAVVSIYAIDHVPRERHLSVFERIHRWLRAGGLALVAIEDGDQPGVVAEWLGAPMFFSTFPAPEERRLAELAGLEVLEAEVESQMEEGVEVPYLWLLARRPSACCA
jgi:cyclopropane fatty-acyl-phospholipid synthase-like methyltransferase